VCFSNFFFVFFGRGEIGREKGDDGMVVVYVHGDCMNDDELRSDKNDGNDVDDE
jgi:hypothetical protein